MNKTGGDMKEEQDNKLIDLCCTINDLMEKGRIGYAMKAVNKYTQEMNKRPSLSVEEIFKLLSGTRSCFCNPNHYSLKEQENIVMKDALAIKSKMIK